MKKPRFEKALPYLFFIFLGFCIADLVILNVRDLMLPNQAPPAKPQRPFDVNVHDKGTYSIIVSRNIFNSDGLIPEPLQSKEGGPKKQQDLPPVLSNLPLTLMGTIVHSIPEKSIANIEAKGKNSILAYRPQMEIDKLATLLKVERNKVIIRNLNNSRLEYLEMKSTSKISFNGAAAVAVPTAGPSSGPAEIKAVGQNKFEVKRSDILKYTNNMAEVLQQAAMAPKRGANGEIEGFKFLSIQPGSIYTKLGFQNGDTIKGVNGEPVDSPAKAMELYNQLKNSNGIKIKRERDGREEEVDYNITE